MYTATNRLNVPDSSLHAIYSGRLFMAGDASKMKLQEAYTSKPRYFYYTKLFTQIFTVKGRNAFFSSMRLVHLVLRKG